MCAAARKRKGFSVSRDTGRDMKVTNLNIVRQTTGSGGKLLARWEKISGQNAFLCCVKDCIERPIAGGLVQKGSPYDQSWYIVPLCRDCDSRTGQNLDIWDGAVLVRKNDMEDLQEVSFGGARAMPGGARSPGRSGRVFP